MIISVWSNSRGGGAAGLAGHEFQQHWVQPAGGSQHHPQDQRESSEEESLSVRELRHQHRGQEEQDEVRTKLYTISLSVEIEKKKESTLMRIAAS